MSLESISITNYKNIESSELIFSSSLNCFVGANGSGKTNILDAIHYLSLTKSAISADKDSVNCDSEFFIIQGKYSTPLSDQVESITASYKRGSKKKISRGSKEYDKLSDHIGRFPLVMIAPQDSALVSSAPDYRRRFLNAFASQIDAQYLSLMMRYNAVVVSRNTLLKNPNSQEEVIDIISEQLADLGSRIHSLRTAYIQQLAPIVEHYYALISGKRERIEIAYKSQLNQESMLEQLRRNMKRDLILGYTSVGVHRDDIELTMNSHPIKAYGSQGQQKSLLIAIKLAEAKLIGEKCGKSAILLLDDVFDKLDMNRVENLISLVASNEFGQIFITDSNKVRLGQIAKKFDSTSKVFEVDGGEIRNSNFQD